MSSHQVLRPLIQADFSLYDEIQRHAYRDEFLESAGALERKIEAFARGCWIVEIGRHPAAYLIAHPWISRSIVSLDAEPFVIPSAPNCFYIHSLTVHRGWQRQGLGRMLARKAFDIARCANLGTITLVSVQQSDAFWRHIGFRFIVPDHPDICEQLQHYGPDAKFMTCMLPGRV
jgi:ribosomal protein S18 acetylase RimI-like enzyme